MYGKKDTTLLHWFYTMQLQDGPLNTSTKDNRIPTLEQKLQYEEDSHFPLFIFLTYGAHVLNKRE